jgi:hypothetical protein
MCSVAAAQQPVQLRSQLSHIRADRAAGIQASR